MQAYIYEEKAVNALQEKIFYHICESGLSEEEFVERFCAIEFDYDEDVKDVLSGSVVPCVPFYVIAGKVLGLSDEEIKALFDATLEDLRCA